MLWFIAVANLIIMGGYHLHPVCVLEDWTFRDEWKKVTPLFETLCSSKSEAYEAIKESWKNGTECWILSPRNNMTDDDIWCTNYFEKGEGCIRNMMEEFQPYLNSEEKFITDFMVDGHKLTMEQLCKDGEDGLRDQVKRNDKRHCGKDIGTMAAYSISECTPKAPFYQEIKDIDVVMNKFDFCSTFRITTKCIIDYLEAHCTGRDLSSFLDTIFESHYDWCKKNT